MLTDLAWIAERLLGDATTTTTPTGTPRSSSPTSIVEVIKADEGIGTPVRLTHHLVEQ